MAAATGRLGDDGGAVRARGALGRSQLTDSSPLPLVRAALEISRVGADDVFVVELAALISSLSLLTASLGGLQASIAQRLAGSDAVAVRQAVDGARRAGLPPAGARVAYARAPYRKPALRYVFATGWAMGTKHPAACAFASLDPEHAITLAIDTLRADGKASRRLGKLHVTAAQAGRAFAAGFVSACGG